MLPNGRYQGHFVKDHDSEDYVRIVNSKLSRENQELFVLTGKVAR